MVQETRTLVFSDEEVFEALSQILADHTDEVPNEGTATLQPHENEMGHLSVDVVFVDESGKVTARIHADEAEVSEALVHYCQAQSIPLPKTIEKRAEWRGENVALIFRMG